MEILKNNEIILAHYNSEDIWIEAQYIGINITKLSDKGFLYVVHHPKHGFFQTKSVKKLEGKIASI